MRYFVLAVAVGAMLGFSLAEDLLDGVDNNFSEGVLLSTDKNPSGDANMFSNNLPDSSQDFADQTPLASNDVSIFSPSDANLDSDLYSDPSLFLAASTCDDRASADVEGLLAGKFRARDSPSTMCYSKDSGVQDWLNKLPRIFGGKKELVPEPEPESVQKQYFGLNRLGNPDKCSRPYILNLCCNGDPEGNIEQLFYDELAVPPAYYKVEDCYESKSMPLLNFRFIFEREERRVLMIRLI